MDEILGFNAVRSGVRNPGRGRCSLRTTAVDAGVNYKLYLMNKTLGLSAGRSEVRIPGRPKFSFRTTAVDAGVNYPL